jgi:hypothetical protein
MQHTPLQPALQLPQHCTVGRQHIPHSDAPFVFAVTHQPFKECAHLANVNVASGLSHGVYSQQGAYGLARLNMHVLLLCGVHCYFSLRYESDFSIEAGNTLLIEAEQLNFWMFDSQLYSKVMDELDTPIEECF